MNKCGCSNPVKPNNGCVPHMSSTVEVTHEHSKLLGLDYRTSGHIGFAGLQTKTVNEWLELANYVPLDTEIIIVSDYKTFLKDEKKVKLPGVKIGNGVDTVLNLPYITDENELQIIEELQRHIADDNRHLIEGEREKLDKNVSALVDNKTLILKTNLEV